MAKNSGYWEKRIASRTWEVYNSAEEKNRKLIEMYKDASQAITNELYRLAEKLQKQGFSRTDTWRNNQLVKLNEELLKEVKRLGGDAESFSQESMYEAFRENYENIAKTLGGVDVVLPNKKAMEKMMREPWRGGDFSSRLWGNTKKLSSALNDTLRHGIQQGKNVTEIAVELDTKMQQGFHAAHRLVRTETMHVLNTSSIEGYKASKVKKVQFWAAEDERTCELCGKLHGKVYDLEHAPVLPLHPNCRCTYLPVVDDGTTGLREKTVNSNKQPLVKGMVNDIIKSGARITDPFSKEAEKFAEMYYPEIRKFSTDVKRIAEHLGKSEGDIKKIKAYLFEEASLFDSDTGIWRRFDPDCSIAQSWQRLMVGKDIKPHDRTLIEHELLEMRIKESNPGIPHDKAHELASQKYNYQKEADEYYGSLEKYKKE